jgi:hypothetical protein
MPFAMMDEKHPTVLSPKSASEMHDARVARAKAKQKMLMDMLRKHYGIYHSNKPTKTPSIVAMLTT